ncbi:MAG: ThiF family adenylyltransferase [Bacteroidales bacterium]|jgi:hypothetical protein
MEEYFEISGKTVDSSFLTDSRAIDVLESVITHDFCQFEKCIIKENGNELIIFTVDSEIGQYPIYDIRKKEKIAVEFNIKENTVPKVFALRKTFPQVPHLNLEYEEFPRSLCLYDLPYEELKVNWTGFRFIERIREWLKLTALGILHQKDQPLEPLLLYYDGTFIFPNDIKKGESLNIYALSKERTGRVNLLATRINYPLFEKKNAVLEIITGEPQLHGIIRHATQNIFQLAEFLNLANINFRDYLLKKIKEYKSSKIDLKQHIIFLIYLPKKRDKADINYIYDTYAFITNDSIEEIGIKIGIWERSEKYVVEILNRTDISDENYKNIMIGTLRPAFTFNKALARRLNNLTDSNDPNILAIGSGAIGSQVFMNCIRAGFGKWTLIDDDILFPHNLSRHDLDSTDVGFPKVVSLATKANNILNDSVAKPVFTNILKDFNIEDIAKELNDVDLILDMSASSSVTKEIGKFATEKSRIVSIFLNPQGTDLIILAEDSQRKIKIDALEVQYYRALLYRDDLQNHLQRTEENIRYSTSCRDISSKVTQDDIATFSAIASKFIKTLNQNTDATISIWISNNADLTIKRMNVEPYAIIEINMGNWTLVFDEWIINKIIEARKSKLPNETGGILIGNYDISQKRMYVVDTILAPEDSEEYPTAYIRGIKNVKNYLDDIDKKTLGLLQYVGEWHSHPDGCSVMRSKDDDILFTWLQINMRKEGLPALMLIAGDNNKYEFYLNT